MNISRFGLLMLCLLMLAPVHAQTDSGWTLVVPGGDAICARETPYAFWTRAGDPDKLLLYFQGGGMCWDPATCAPGAGAFDDIIEGGEIGAYSRGIFDTTNPENPLASYSAVFVPYCTGDWHTGARTVDYGEMPVHHNGYANASSALAWAYANVPRPVEVVVSGCSAGSYGAIYHAPAILRRYRNADLVFGDAGAGRIPAGWGGFDLWGTFDHTRRAAPETLVETLYQRAAAAYPGVRFGVYTTAEDNQQQRYFAMMGGVESWTDRTINALNGLDRLANFDAYLAPGGEHCLLETDRFYGEVVNGVRFRDSFAEGLD